MTSITYFITKNNSYSYKETPEFLFIRINSYDIDSIPTLSTLYSNKSKTYIFLRVN